MKDNAIIKNICTNDLLQMQKKLLDFVVRSTFYPKNGHRILYDVSEPVQASETLHLFLFWQPRISENIANIEE